MYLSYPQTNIVIFYVGTSLCKGHVFQLDISENIITVFVTTMLSMGTLKCIGNPTTGIENYVVYQ